MGYWKASLPLIGHRSIGAARKKLIPDEDQILQA